MLEQSLLRDEFQTLLDQQRNAARLYADLAAKSGDPRIRQQAQELQRDKLRHIRLTERLLEIVD